MIAKDGQIWQGFALNSANYIVKFYKQISHVG